MRARPHLLVTGIALILLGPAVLARAQDPATPEAAATDPIFRVSVQRTRTRIVERFSKVVELGARIRRVDGFDPEILNVTGIQGRPNQIRVHAVAPGVTTLSLTDEGGAIYTVEVFVTGDVRHLQAYLSRMFPHASVEAVEVQDSVVLRGWVTQPSNITKMVEIAEQFYPRVLNQMDVGGAQQVQLRVQVMEVQRSKLRRFGINWLFFNQNAYLASTPGSLAPITSISNIALGQGTPQPNVTTFSDTTIFGGIVGNDGAFQGFVDALKQESLLKILAEPELVTTNGRPANMLAGGEFPILVPQSLGTTTIEWREFGVRLEAVPHILGRGRVRLELQPEVSERDFTNAVTLNGTTIPGLTTRRVNTQVEMKFGETFVLAGLISNRRDSTTQKLPFFGELPWIGAAFRRVNYTEAETELVIMVTPELVGPMARHEIPARGPGRFTDAPTDPELIRDGLIEVPWYGDHCPSCGENFGPNGCGCSVHGGGIFQDGPIHGGPIHGGAMPHGAYPGGPAPSGPFHGEPIPGPGAPVPNGVVPDGAVPGGVVPEDAPAENGPALAPVTNVPERTTRRPSRPTGRPGLIGPRSRIQQVSGRN